MKLSDDTRWRRFNDKNFRCACCGQSFGGIFNIDYDHPDAWPHGEYRNNVGEPIKVGHDFLGSDFCWANGDVFIRGLVEIPIVGTEMRFGFGVWSTLHPANAKAYFEVFGTEQELGLGTCFGWLSNDLPVYGTGGFLQTSVNFQGNGKRPLFTVFDENTQLSSDQLTGISFDQLLDIYAACGVDVRPHLQDA